MDHKYSYTHQLYFNPRSPRGGATADLAHDARRKCISIHAPHEGERRHRDPVAIVSIVISIHAPHEGERPRGGYHGLYIELFQSTLPTRGSDVRDKCRGGIPCRISIHAPHEGERLFLLPHSSPFCFNFNPRSPRGGATGQRKVALRITLLISIHAPHEGERRVRPYAHIKRNAYFNPRSPRGGATRAYIAVPSIAL